MSKLNAFVVMNIVVAFAAVSSMAGPVAPGNLPQLSWADFRNSCLHPEQYGVQVPSRQITVTCIDKQNVWLADAPGQVVLDTTRRMTAKLVSDKFQVAQTVSELPAFSKTGACHRFKEVEETVAIEHKITCDDALGIKGELGEFCAGVVDEAKGENPKVVETKDTGRALDTCANAPR